VRQLFLPLLLVPLLLLGLESAPTWTARERRKGQVATLFLLASLGIRAFHLIESNIRNPSEWDFMCFWLWGKLGAHRASFYDPESTIALARQLAGQFSFSPHFTHGFIEVGFLYPPPTMLLLAPLGFFSASTAAALWYLLQVSCLVGASFLLWRLFASGTGRLGLLFILAFMLVLPASHRTLLFAQTNFLALFLGLLLLRYERKGLGGVFAATSVFTKPYLAIWFGYLALKRRWKAFFAGLATAAALCGVSAAVFGVPTFLAYFRENPTPRLPSALFSPPINQSLWGKFQPIGLGESAGVSGRMMVFTVIALTLVMATAYLVSRTREPESGLGLALVTTTGLIIFPSTQGHYSVLLAIPLFCLWSRRRQLRLPLSLLIAFITLESILTGIANGSYSFWANAAAWCALAVAAAQAGAEARSLQPATGVVGESAQ